jgi:hypothetical protein
LGPTCCFGQRGEKPGSCRYRKKLESSMWGSNSYLLVTLKICIEKVIITTHDTRHGWLFLMTFYSLLFCASCSLTNKRTRNNSQPTKPNQTKPTDRPTNQPTQPKPLTQSNQTNQTNQLGWHRSDLLLPVCPGGAAGGDAVGIC